MTNWFSNLTEQHPACTATPGSLQGARFTPTNHFDVTREGEVSRPKSDSGQRQAIISATLKCIHQFGYEGTSVSRICAATGLSAGNIHYYFGGKQQLLEEAMRMLLRDVRGRMVKNLSKAKSPNDRIIAIVESNLDVDLFTQENSITWLHFWAQAPHSKELARLENINRTRFRRNLLHELTRLHPRNRADLLARQVVAVIDGFWVEKAQSASQITSQEAIQAVMDILNLANQSLSPPPTEVTRNSP